MDVRKGTTWSIWYACTAECISSSPLFAGFQATISAPHMVSELWSF